MTKMALKTVLAWAFVRRAGYWAGARRARAMAALCYHRVSDGPDPLGLCVSEPEFAQQMQTLARSPHLAPVGAAEFEAIWTGRREYGTRVPVLVSFDDGFRDNLSAAAPVLGRYGVPAIVFVATDVLRGRPLWYDLVERLVRVGEEPALRRALAGLGIGVTDGESPRGARYWVGVLRDLDGELFARAVARLERLGEDLDFGGQYLSPDDLRQWAALGMDVGAHTCSHPRLTAVSDTEAARQMDASKRALEEVLGWRVRHFAYPFGGRGDFAPAHAGALARLGFTMAFTGLEGCNRAGRDPFAIRRKCINAGLFAQPGAAFSPSLFLADLMGLKTQLAESLTGALRAARVPRGTATDG